MLSLDNALLLFMAMSGMVLYLRYAYSLRLGAAALGVLRATITVVTFLPLFSGKAIWHLLKLRLLDAPNGGKSVTARPPRKKGQKGRWVWVTPTQRIVSNQDIEALVFDVLERVVQDRQHMGCAVRAYKNGRPQGVLFQHRNGTSELLTVSGWKDVSGDFAMFAPETRVRLTNRPAPPEEPPPFSYDPNFS